MQRIPRPIQILLGKWKPELGRFPPLDSQGTKRVQGIVGALLYYAHAVNNKLLVGLSAIGSQQASAKQRTNEPIDQILDYCTTYPVDGILCCSNNMVLSAHSDAASTIRTREKAELEHIF